MKFSNNIIEKIVKHIPFFVFIIPVVVYHVILYYIGDYGDDLGIRKAMSDYTFLEHMKMRYFGHSSRVAGDSLTAMFVQLPYSIFILADIIVCGALYYILSKLLVLKERWQQYALALILLMYPFRDTLSAGPIATVTNYLWTLTTLFVLVYFERRSRESGLPWYSIFIIVFSLFETCLFQMTAVIFMFYLCGIVINNKLRGVNLFSPLTILYSICSVVGMTIILVSPATENRLAFEVPQFCPNFYEYGLLEKVTIGLYRMSQILLGQFNQLFILACCLIMSIGVKVDSKHKLLYCFPSVAVGTSLLLKSTGVLSYDRYYLCDGEPILQIYSPILLLLLVCMISMYCIFRIETCGVKFGGSVSDFGYIVFILFMGFATQFVMGFAPSVYESGDRTAIYLYFSLILTIFFLVIRFRKVLSVCQIKIYNAVIVLLTFVDFVFTCRELIRPIFVDIRSFVDFVCK